MSGDWLRDIGTVVTVVGAMMTFGGWIFKTWMDNRLTHAINSLREEMDKKYMSEKELKLTFDRLWDWLDKNGHPKRPTR